MSRLGKRLPSTSAFLRRRPSGRKAALYLAIAILTFGIISLVLLTPLLLRQLSNIKGIDWAELSSIGQTYGAASAILSTLALIGISLSLIVQARQARIERVRITRERHMELLRLILDDPDTYGPILNIQEDSKLDLRQFLFCTMWINYARMGYQSGVLAEEDLRVDILGATFKNEPLRRWWEGAGYYWTNLEDYNECKFVKIIQDEYDKAIAAGPPLVVTAVDHRQQTPVRVSTRGRILAGTAAAAAIGVILGSRMRRPHL